MPPALKARNTSRARTARESSNRPKHHSMENTPMKLAIRLVIVAALTTLKADGTPITVYTTKKIYKNTIA